MAQLTSDKFSTLKKGILDAFSERAALEPVARNARGRSLEQLAIGNSVDEIVDRLIRRADDEGWLGELLRALCDARPASEALKDFQEKWRTEGFGPLGGAAGAPVDHFRVLLLPGRRALINRQDLRVALASLTDDQGARVLVVDGDDESGKSYTVQYVGYLCEALANFQFATVDLERVPKSGNNKIDAYDIGAAISDALVGAPPFDRPDDHNLATWVDRYCNWLGRRLPPRQTQWLVVDSFRKVGMEQNAYDVVAALAMRTYRELSTLRLVLLSYRDVEWLKARVIGAVEYERIASIDDRHLATFFGQLFLDHHKRIGQPVDAAVVVPKISAAVRRVLAEAESSNTRRLETIGRTAWVEAATILHPQQPQVDDLAALVEQVLGQGGANEGAPTNTGEGQ